MTTHRDETPDPKPEAKHPAPPFEAGEDDVVDLGQLHSSADPVQDSSTGNSVDDWGSLVEDVPADATPAKKGSPVDPKRAAAESGVQLSNPDLEVVEEDAVIEAAVVEDEVVEGEILEDEVLEGEIVEDEVLEGEIIEDEVIAGEIVEDEVVVGKIVDDVVEEEPVAADLVEEEEVVSAVVDDDEVDFAPPSPKKVAEPAKPEKPVAATMAQEPDPEPDALPEHEIESLFGKASSAAFGQETVMHDRDVAEDEELADKTAGLDFEAVEDGETAMVPSGKKAAGETEAVEEEEETGLVEADEEPAEEEEKPKKKAKAERKRGGMLVGTFVGLLLGALVCGGLWLFRVEPPEGWREAVSGPAPSKPGLGAKQGPPVTPPKTVTFDDKLALLHSGDFDKLKDQGLDTIDENIPEQLAARGEFRWLEARRSGKAINAKDEAVVAALADLKKANEAKPDDATIALQLGRLYEVLGDYPAARKVYTAGVAAPDKGQKGLFETALTRLTLKEGLDPKKTSRLPQAENLLLILTGLVAPEPDEKAPTPEAGVFFLKALTALRKHDFKVARSELERARAAHEARSRLMPNRSSNPVSDPEDEIILWLSKELENYCAAMEKCGSLSLDAFITEAASNKTMLEANKKQLATAVEENKANATKLTDLQKQLQTKTEQLTNAQTEAKTQLDKLNAANQLIDAEKKKVLAAQAEIAKLTKSDKDKTATLGEVAKSLVEGKYLEAGGDSKALEAGVKSAVSMARTVDPDGAMKKLKAELSETQAVLKERWTPAQMLAYWVPLLQIRNGRKELAEAASLDAHRVLANAAAPPELKAGANLVLGLALRNLEKFAEAKAPLEMAKAGLKNDVAVRVAETALAEVSDPASGFLLRAAEMRTRNRGAEALPLLNHGLELIPGDVRLLAARAQIYLDQGDSVNLAAARKDAEAASKAGSAEGHYLLGQIAEAEKSWDKAADAYRSAITATKSDPVAVNKYKAALARVLTLSPSVRQVSRDESDKAQANRLNQQLITALSLLSQDTHDFSSLMMLTMVLAGPEDEKNQEAVKLADEILDPKSGASAEAKAQALAVKGQFTKALLTYVEGLKPTLRKDQYDGLREIIKAHPLLQSTESSGQDSLAAERFYFQGRNHFNAKNWAGAEKNFRSAIDSYPQDARYFYFLGLTRWQEGERDAAEFFRQGVKLEGEGRPRSDKINREIENVQGAARRVLDQARTGGR